MTAEVLEVNAFSNRLRAAMAAAGIEWDEQLARRISALRQKGPVVTRALIENWQTTNGNSMTANDLMDCSQALNIRAKWLARNQGMPTPLVHGTQEAELLMLWDGISPEKRGRILHTLRNMAGERK